MQRAEPERDAASTPRCTTSTGQLAEDLSVSLLVSRGYRIVTRNYRSPGGEVDIIAWDGDVLCFVEVRSRTSEVYGDPLESITLQKRRRVAQAAWHFVEYCLGSEARSWPVMRFDAVGVILSAPPRLRLVRDAFEEP